MAETGNETPEMLYEMGKRFYLPSSGVADPLLALYYFGKAAEQGYAPAQRILGTCFLEGRLTAVDYGKAKSWLTAAANQGDGQAAYSLALIYAKGLGVPKDWHLAWQLLEREESAHLQEARALKEKLKDELIRSHPKVADRLKQIETERRKAYSPTRQRFIMPWFSPGRPHSAKDEYCVWLSLNLQKISEDEAFKHIHEMMCSYYHQLENQHH